MVKRASWRTSARETVTDAAPGSSVYVAFIAAATVDMLTSSPSPVPWPQSHWLEPSTTVRAGSTPGMGTLVVSVPLGNSAVVVITRLPGGGTTYSQEMSLNVLASAQGGPASPRPRLNTRLLPCG